MMKHKHIWTVDRIGWNDFWYCEVEGCDAKPRKDVGDTL